MTAPASAPVRPAQVPAVAGWLDRRSRPAPALRWSGLVLAYTALTILFTWPFATHLSEKVLNASDPVESIWRLGWAQEQLLHAPWRLFAGNTFYPYPRSYLFDELLVGPALLTLPVRLVWHNPVAVYNVAVLASCVLSALAMYALARRVGCGAAAAFAAGLIYAFAPHHFVHFTSGHLTLLSAQYIPLVVLLLDRLFAAPSWRDAFLLAGALALQALSSQYYAIYLVFVVLGFLAVRLVRATWRRRLPRWGVWARLLVAGGLAALVVLPFAVGYARVQRDYGFARPPEETAFWSSHLTSFLTADPQNWFWARPTAPLRTGRYISERNLFPGLLALALAVVGAITSRRRPLTAYFALLALGSAVLALGPRLYLTDDRSRALFTPLPYAMLYRSVPGIDAMRSPDRFGVLFGLSAAVLAGLGLQWLLGRMLRLRALGVPTRARVLAALVVMALVGGIGLESLNRPYTLQSLATGESIPPVYRWLAAQPATVIVELPFLVPTGSREVVVNNRFQYFSLYHRHPALNGSADIVPKGYTALAEELLYGPTPRALAILQGLGTTHIVVHYDLVRELFGPRIEGLTRTALETPGLVSAAATFGSDVVYRLAPGEQFAQLRAIVPREATVYLSREDPLGTYGGMLGWVLRENRIYTRVRVHFGQVYAGRPAPGTPYDYGVLYAPEDPAGAGFDRAEVVWQDNVVRVYRRLPP